MAISIAGREVKIGDKLYHWSLGKWGQVTRFDASGPAILEVSRGPTRSPLKFYVQQGGNISGKREAYWHGPLKLDLPRSDVSTMQRIVDLLAHEFKS